MILKKKIQLNFVNTAKIYNSDYLNTERLQIEKHQLLLFSILMHKKLTYFKYLVKNKQYIYSIGQLLGKKIKKIKFFKKSLKNFGYVVTLLNRKFSKPISSIYIFYCKNFNYKNYLWIKKFYFLTKPEVNYFIISGSWNYIKKKKKRIKRKIFKNLFNNTKFV